MKKKKEYFNGQNCQIGLSEKFLVITVDETISDVYLELDSTSKSGQIWRIVVEKQKYAVLFTESYPDLIYGKTYYLRSQKKRKLKIPLAQNVVMKSLNHYLGKPRYVRSKEIKSYWENKIKSKT